MGFDLTNFRDAPLDAAYLQYLIEQEGPDTAGRFGRLWDYFANPLRPLSGPVADAADGCARPYVQAQEMGLPARITGFNRHGGRTRPADRRRKEVVIENDIAWRIHAMVDFLFGRGITVRSQAEDPTLAATIDAVVAALLEANGGVRFCQEMALFGAVYGFVDIALRAPAGESVADVGSLRPAGPGGDGSPAAVVAERSPRAPLRPGPPASSGRSAESVRPSERAPGLRRRQAAAAARCIALECIEAGRVLPVLDPDDYRQVRCWVQHYRKRLPRVDPARRRWFAPARSRDAAPVAVEVVEILSPTWWQRYEDRALVDEGPNALGRLPVVHVQNVSLPGRYGGLSDVEPLVPLQDELNTRLSDRASRVTFQSFKMYLGKGIDDFLERPVAPGQMWSTHNLDACIEEFGSDAAAPSEDTHIAELRRALDKVSAVTPLAAGLIEGNVGHLTSATALRVVLGGLLARTQRKRLTYGAGLARLVELALAWLDRTGVLPTRAEDRRVEIDWPGLLPADESEQLRNALTKTQLGVPADRVLAELGYARDATGVA
ncbi:MAG: phage portal protein [Phycisphaerae bacterium]|nr:phage portal protein [Phycisphaerae bacterium]